MIDGGSGDDCCGDGGGDGRYNDQYKENKSVMHYRQNSIFFSFEWKVRDVDSKVITIEPRTGTICAGERQVGLHSTFCILFSN